MIRRRHEERVKINHIDTQILQVIHFIQNSLQIPSVKFTNSHGVRIFIPILYLHRISANISVFIRQHIVFGISIIKTVYVYLVHHGSLCPFRRFVTRYQPEIAFPDRFLLYTAVIEIATHLSRIYFKIIMDLPALQLYLLAIIIKKTIRLRF